MTKEQIEKEYRAGECDYITAIELLQKHCGLSSKEAEQIVCDWEE